MADEPVIAAFRPSSTETCVAKITGLLAFGGIPQKTEVRQPGDGCRVDRRERRQLRVPEIVVGAVDGGLEDALGDQVRLVRASGGAQLAVVRPVAHRAVAR